MKKLLFFIAPFWLSLPAMAQSVKVTGPSVICTSTFATFDCAPQSISGTVTSIQWTIPNAVYIAGSPTSSSPNGRNVTVQFTDTGTFNVSVSYTYTNSKGKVVNLTSNKSVNIINCPSTDCQGTKASAPFLFEDFGTLPVTISREPLPPPAYTSYQYLASGSVNDGQYIISDNTNNGRPEWVTTGDHTGNPNGNMMIVNASYQPDTFYTRVINGLCGGVQYSFSAWLLNVDSKKVLDTVCAGVNIFPNVDFEVLDAKTGVTLGNTTTHDVSMKLKNDVNGNPIDDPTWQQYGFGFKTPVGVDSIKLLMYNIAPGGCGNDLAIDDIKFTYCGPQLVAYFKEPGITGDTVCAGKPDTIFSYVTPGYFTNPTYQWQKSKDEVNWINIPGATNANYIFPATDTSDSYYYRFLAAEQGNIGKSTCNSPSNIVDLLVLRSPYVNPGDTLICYGGTATLQAQPGYSSYLWSTGATTSSISVSPTTTTKYYVTATLSSGAAGSCTDTDSSLVTVFNPNLFTLPTDTGMCAGDTILLNANPLNLTYTNLTYKWNTGDTTPSIRVSKTGQYSVIISNGVCGSVYDTVQVVASAPPVINLGNDTSICSGQSVTLDAGNAGSTFLWNTGATTQTISANTSGNYSVTVTNTNGCSAINTRKLTVNPLPVVNLGNDTSVCSGQSVTLDAGNAGSNFLWNTGATTQTINANTSGNYNVTVTNPFGCSTSGTRKLTVNSLPVINLGNDTSVCSGQSVTLDAGNAGSTFLWNTGATTQTINANTSGNYSVTVTNTNGCSATSTRKLTVNPLPVINLGNDTSVCFGQSVTLDAGNIGSTFLWSTGATTQTINANTSGNYSVTATNPFGCSSSGTRKLTVNPLPVVNLGNDTSVCSGQSVTLDAGNAGSTFLWNIGATTQTINANASGNYSVTVTNTNGCSAINTRKLTVNPLPVVNLGNDTSVCSGQSVTLDAGNAGSTFLWNTGATTETISSNASGNYSVTVTNPFGCSTSGTRKLTVNPLPVINLGNDTSVCSGQSVTLDAGNAGSTFLWNTGATTETISSNASGNYSVTVTNPFGCSTSGTRKLTVNPLPVINLGNDTSVCSGQSVTLDAGNSGSTFLWNTGATTQTINANISGNYSVTVTNTNGCSATSTRKLTVNPLPVVNLGNDTSVCSGQSVTLDAGNAGSTFLWNTGATTQTINANTSGNYSVTVTNTNGCSAINTRKLTVNPLPVVNLGNDTSVCSGQSVTLDAGNAGSNFLWNTGATTQTINANTSGNYSVTVTNPFGCSTSGTRKLTVNPLPVINLGNDTSVCSGQSVTLDAGNSGSTFLWNTGATTQTINANISGNYSVTVTNTNGCSATSIRKLTVNPLPVVNLGNDTSVCSGQSVTLDAGNSGSTFMWNTGATTQTINANTSGNYSVTVTNTNGCSAINTRKLTVNPLPVVNLGNDTSVCFGQSVTLDAGNAGSTFLWNTGATTQTINANTSGNYSVTVTSPFGCSASGTRKLTVNPLPAINLGNDTSVCSGQSVTLDAGNAGSTFLWNTGATTQTINASASGIYNVKITNSFGCSFYGAKMLTVNPLPVINLRKDTSVCAGQSITLDAGNTGSSFLWNTGSSQQAISAFQQGQYWVNVKNKFGCAQSDSILLRVNPLPRLSLNRQASLCEGSKVQLKPEAESNNYTYQWNDGSTEPVLNISAAGTYWVIVSNGLCLTIDTTEVVLLKNNLPAINGFQTLCPNTTIQLSAYSTEAIAYQWNTGETNNAIHVNKPGVYTVQVQGSYCNYSRNDTIRVQTGQLPAVHIVADDTVICEGDRIRLLAIGNDVEGYRWQDGSFGPFYAATNPGYYTVQAFNQCGVANDSLNLLPGTNCIVSILVPTAFSPNGDGNNDIFRPFVKHQIYNYELRIFNRWGQLVFLSHNPEQGWDGTFHGVPCEIGGYAWWIKYSEIQNGTPIFKKGVVTLVR